MTNLVRYESGASRPGPSNFWGTLQPWHGVDPNEGWGFFEHFSRLLVSGTDTIVLEEADDNAAWSNVVAEECGIMRLTIVSDANEEGSMQHGKLATHAPLCIDGGYGRMWFEGRIKTSLVTTGALCWVFGLAEEGFAAANCIIDGAASPTTDGTGIVGKDFVGFGLWVDAGTEIDAFYHTAGSASVIHKAAVGTMAAATWIKLGLYFDGDSKLWFYVNGVPYATAALDSATGFPDGEELSPVLAVKDVSGAAATVDIDWWGGAQEAVVGVNC